MRIIIEYFVISAFLTMFIRYLLNPSPRVIVKLPDPTKNISDIYVDDHNVHYRYHRKEII